MVLERAGNKKSTEKPKYTREQEKDLGQSRREYETRLTRDHLPGSAGPDSLREHIISNAIVEKYFRKEIEYRGIKMSDEDISKIIAVGQDMLHTINADVERLGDPAQPTAFEYKSAFTQFKKDFNAAEIAEFLKRFPMDKLRSAYFDAFQKAKAEMASSEERFEAKRTIDQL